MKRAVGVVVLAGVAVAVRLIDYGAVIVFRLKQHARSRINPHDEPEIVA